MMGLLDKQLYFTKLLARLIEYATEKGYGLTMGPAWHPPGLTPRYAGDPHPMTNDCHGMRLAVDLNLFIDEVYVTGEHPAFNDLGAFWKKLDPLCHWGGDFDIVDLDHFSITHNGYF